MTNIGKGKTQTKPDCMNYCHFNAMIMQGCNLLMSMLVIGFEMDDHQTLNQF